MIAIFKNDVDIICATTWFDKNSVRDFAKEALKFISIAYLLTIVARNLADKIPNGPRIEDAIAGIINPAKWDVVASLGLTTMSVALFLSVFSISLSPLRKFAAGILQMCATWGLIAVGCFLAIFTLNLFQIEKWSFLLALQGTFIFVSILLLIYINGVLWFSQYIITDQKTHERIKPEIDKISFTTKFIVTLLLLGIFSFALLVGV